ncbi:Ig-like domain-containing protein [uncultured Desulfobacter sp.]|uniref:beta strand repeat-containing protein n=1 Tax=uncultured Desulfobacter sp. TaxID=240139 RepID=UPI0029F499C7|nr:Ig-like domain-containing protein [uncultured Desulfobacter sp.]
MLVLIEKQKDNQIVEYPLDLLISLTAEPGAVYTIEDTETGEPPEDLVLKKKGETLEIEVDGETVAQVEAFFVPESDTLFSADGSFTPIDHMSVSGDVTEVSGDDSQVVWQADDGDGNALAWTGGLLALAGIGGAVAAAGGGGSSSGESETPSQTTYKLIVSAAAGPFTSDVRVEVYDKDGNLLEASAHNFGADSLKVTLTTGYTGPIFVKVIDANDTDGATPDFRNETGEAVDLSFDLRAMAMADGTGDVYVTVSPLTELAVRAADVDETSFTEASLAYNQYVAEAFGVDDIVGTSPVTTIKSDGTSNPDFNGSDGLSSGEQYGKVLAQLSGADDIDQALTTLSESLVVDEEQGAGFTQDGQILIEESAAEYEEKRDAYQESQGEDLPSFEPDNTPPTVTITDNTDGTATSDVTYTFTFNEAVTGFTADDIDVTGGSKGTFTAVSGTVYTLVVAPDADSTTNITVDVAADVATDAAGNYNSAADQSSQAVDTIAPTVTITDDTTGTATGDVIFTFTFSEAVTGFASDDVDVTGGTKGTFTAISDTVYTLVVTPNDDSTTDITVDVSTDVATDAAGNSNTPATQSVQAVDTTVPDTTAPTVSITDDTAGTATGDVTYTFTFSEAVTGFTADDVDVTGGSKGAFTAVSDSVYTLVVAPDAGSTTDITVDVAADVAVDGAGNSNTATTQSVQAVDTQAPTVAITDDTPGTATGDVTYTFTFSEPVTGFTADDVDVTGGSKGAFTAVSDSVYTLVVAPDAGSTTDITVDVAADVAVDGAGNSNTAATQSVQAVNTEAPTVAITDDTAGTATGDVTYTFTFSEAVTGFTADDVDVTGGSKGAFTAVSGTVYTLVVAPDAGSTTDITVDVAADVAVDGAGNSNTAATQSVQAVDTQAPTVAITDNTSGTATGDVTYTFTFSEAVTGFTADDVDVTGGSKGAFTAVSGTVYTLVVAPDAGSTTDITVDVAADVAVDGAGNSNTAATQSVQAVDTQAPTVAITDDTPGTATGDVTYTFTFSEAVTGFTADDVDVTGGSKGAFTAVSDSVYTLVVAPDASSTTDITVDVAADVAVDGAGNSNTAATQSVQAVDTQVPTVAITDNTSGTATGDVTYTFTFSEAVTGFTADDVDVTGGSKGTFTAVSGTVYTLVVAPDAGSTTDITVDVAADVAVDGAGNSNTAATQSVQAVDTQAPTVAITDNTAGTATGDVTYTFTFSEAVTGFTADDVDVTGGSKGAFTAVSGTVYTLVVAPDAGSTTDITVDVAADVAVDAAGNSNTAATQSVQAVDTQAPTVAITDNTSGTATGDVTYTFTFSEAVTGFTADDVDVTGGSKGAFTAVSGTVYTLVVAPDAGSTTDITVDVAADVAVDAAGNSNTAATQSVQAVDTQVPTVAITDNTSGTATGDVTYTFTFSEAVTGFTADDVDVTGGSKGAFTAVSGTVYTLVVAPDAGSTTDITVDVAADVAVDAAGNSNTAATQSVQAVDTQAPTVAITDDTPGTATGDVTYTFTFSEAVTGFTADDVGVTGGSKGTFTAVSGTVYTLVVAPDAGSTTDITVDVAADVAVDGAGNSNTAATQSVQAVDTQAPTVAITDDTSGTATGDVTYTFTFSEAVTGFTADDVDVTGGSKGTFTAVSGTVYTLVVAPDAGSTTDITVDVAADVAVDGAGNSNTAATQSVQAVDTQVPTVAITDDTAGTATGDVTYTFTFSEAVTGFTADDVDVTGGSKDAFTAVSDSVYTLVVAPDAGSTTDITVDVAADVAVDGAGNSNTAATQSVQAVDTQAPTVAITDDTPGTATGDVTYTFTFSESVTGFTTDDVDVTGGSKGAFTAVSDSVYTLVVAPDASSTTDITVDVAADVAVDGAGNSNTAATQSVQAVDTTTTAFTGNYAVVTSAGIFADENNDHVKDGTETNELTGTELSTWLSGGARTIVFNDAPDTPINLSGFTSGDKIGLTVDFYGAVFDTINVHTNTFRQVITNNSNTFYWSTSYYFKGVGISKGTTKLYYGSGTTLTLSKYHSGTLAYGLTTTGWISSNAVQLV